MDGAESGVFFNTADRLIYSEDPSLFTTAGRSGFDYQVFVQAGGDAEPFTGTQASFSDAEGNLTLNTDLTEIRVAYTEPFPNVAYISSRLVARSELWAGAYWLDSSDTWGRSIKQTSDGGFIVVGAAEAWVPDAKQGGYVLKLDKWGEPEWSRFVYLPPPLENSSMINKAMFNDVVEVGEGRYVLAGMTHIFYATTRQDIYVCEIIDDDDTITLGRSTLFGKNDGNIAFLDIPYSIEKTYDTTGDPSGYIISGITGWWNDQETTSMELNTYLLKIKEDETNAFNLEWSSTFERYNLHLGYNTHFPDWVPWLFVDSQQTDDGGYITMSGFNSISKIRPDGMRLSGWPNEFTQFYEGTYTRGTMVGWPDCQTVSGLQSVQKTADGGYIMAGFAGESSTGPEGVRGCFIKTDADGEIGGEGWTLYTDEPGDVRIYSILETFAHKNDTVSDGYVAVGMFFGWRANYHFRNFYICKINTAGGIEWSRKYKLEDYGGTSDWACSVSQVYNDDGARDGYVMLGESSGNFEQGTPLASKGITKIICVIRTDNDGKCPPAGRVLGVELPPRHLRHTPDYYPDTGEEVVVFSDRPTAVREPEPSRQGPGGE